MGLEMEADLRPTFGLRWGMAFLLAAMAGAAGTLLIGALLG